MRYLYMLLFCNIESDRRLNALKPEEVRLINLVIMRWFIED
jgi:hypothetical protein